LLYLVFSFEIIRSVDGAKLYERTFVNAWRVILATGGSQTFLRMQELHPDEWVNGSRALGEAQLATTFVGCESSNVERPIFDNAWEVARELVHELAATEVDCLKVFSASHRIVAFKRYELKTDSAEPLIVFEKSAANSNGWAVRVGTSLACLSLADLTD
jgi:hypothetical protein